MLILFVVSGLINSATLLRPTAVTLRAAALLQNRIVMRIIAIPFMVSARTSESRIEQLRNHRSIGYVVTITFNTGINLILKVFLVDVTLGLGFTHESYNFEHQTIVNLTVSKFDGIEVNNHVTIFGSELHNGNACLHYRDNLKVSNFNCPLILGVRC